MNRRKFIATVALLPFVDKIGEEIVERTGLTSIQGDEASNVYYWGFQRENSQYADTMTGTLIFTYTDNAGNVIESYEYFRKIETAGKNWTLLLSSLDADIITKII